MALVIVTFAVFHRLTSSSFLNYDDNQYVFENTHVQQGLRADSIAWALTATDAANWHPLTWVSHMLDVQLFGLDAGKHHRTSLALHALNSALVFLLFRRMTGALWRPALVAALFALHPLHVESVAWVSERKDVLSTLFWLLTLAAWLWYLESRRAAAYTLVLGLYACGLMAKPMLVTLPFTLFLLDYWPLDRWRPGRTLSPLAKPGARGGLPTRHATERPWPPISSGVRALLLEKAPLFAMAALSCVVTFLAQARGGSVQTLDDLGLSERIANALIAYVVYLGKTFWPSSLAIIYPHPHIGLVSWQAAGAALVLACATAFCLRLAGAAPYLLWGWAWYLGTLVPVIGLVQVGDQAMADRYTYLPLLGIFVALAWGLGALVGMARPRKVAASIAAGLWLGALAALARVQTGYWAGNEPLYRHALAVTSDNWLVCNNYGFHLASTGRDREAAEILRTALRIKPNYADAHRNLGLALTHLGAFPEALEECNEALRLRPDLAENHYNVGNVLANLGRVDESIDQFGQALRIRPDYAEAHNNLGAMLVRKGRNPEAREQYETAIRLQPGYFEARLNLADLLIGAGKVDAAIEQYTLALRARPDDATALNKLGAALGRANRLKEAIETFRRALQLRPDSADTHNNLGVALAQTNRLREAIEQFKEALRIDPGSEEARENLRRAQGTASR